MRASLVGFLLGAAACGHNDLYAPTDPAADSPLGSGAFHRVTYDPESDLFPQWVPTGDSVVYAFTADDAGADRCDGVLPFAGGTRRNLPCRPHTPPDSVADANWPAPAADGRIAFVWEAIRAYPSLPFPDTTLLVVHDPAVPGHGEEVFRLPHAIPGGYAYHTLSHLAWLGGDTLVAVGVTNTVIRDCMLCPYRPVSVGREVVLIDLTTSPATLSVVPGTYPATSVSIGAAGNDVYYSLAGDARVYHRVLSDVTSSVLHDFGAAGIARDVTVAGGRLAAVVGGNVTFQIAPVIGAVQEDSGGPILVVTLDGGATAQLPDSGVAYRHPVLALQGNRLMAEGWALGRSDLWVFDLP